MDSVFPERSSPYLERPRSSRAAAAQRAARQGASGKFARTVAYAAGCALVALGILARLVAEEAQAIPRPEARTAAGPAAPSATLLAAAASEGALPLAPQPAALIDRAAHPDLQSARLALAARADAATRERPRMSIARLDAATSRTGLRRAYPARGGSGLGDALAVHTPTRGDATLAALPQSGLPPLTPAASEVPAPHYLPAAEVRACPTCDCADLQYKQLFTQEPLRREEQAWYRGHCPP
jgi:hypothetical protein